MKTTIHTNTRAEDYRNYHAKRGFRCRLTKSDLLAIAVKSNCRPERLEAAASEALDYYGCPFAANLSDRQWARIKRECTR